MKTSFVLLFTLLAIACSTQNKQNKSASKITEISFGSGGGFTGATNTYLLKADREVFKMNNGEYLKINKISRADIRNISETINKINFYNLEYSEKGNITYFIEIKSADSQHKITWSDNTETPELKDFYAILVTTLKPE
jgi:hypothetical protein